MRLIFKKRKDIMNFFVVTNISSEFKHFLRKPVIYGSITHIFLVSSLQGLEIRDKLT